MVVQIPSQSCKLFAPKTTDLDEGLLRFTTGLEFPFFHNRLHPSDIPPDVAHSHGVLELVGGMLKPEIKQLLCELI
jgi:hypothetical protein